MKRVILCASMGVCVSLSQAGFAQSGVITLAKQSDIDDANKVEQAINAMTSKVMGCVKNKLAQPAHCHCLYPNTSNNLKQVYDKVLNAHPDWKDKVVFYSDAGNGFGHNISFRGLRMQFEQKCK